MGDAYPLNEWSHIDAKKFLLRCTMWKNDVVTDRSRLDVLADAARDGDDRALTALLRELQPPIWRLCRALASPADPDDLTQDALIAFVRALPRWRRDGNVMAYAMVIARRVCVDSVRATSRHRRLLALVGRQPSPPGHIDADDHDVSDLLSSVKADRREAFVLTQLVGLPYDVAAEVLGIPVGTVRSRVSRARADLMSAHRDIDAV